MLKKVKNSLGFQVGFTIAMAIITGVLCFMLVSSVGKYAVEKVYMSVSANEERMEKISKDFEKFSQSQYNNDNPIISIQEWLKNKPGLYLYAFEAETDRLIFESDGYFTTTYNVSNSNSFLNRNVDYIEVKQKSGNYNVVIKDNTYMEYFNYVDYAALIIGCLVAIVILFVVFGKTIKRILTLSRQVKAVSCGDMERTVSIDGTDEIGELGKNIDVMRRSIIEHYQKEQDAIKANNDLLTSISHDIRTPLTSIIGFSELMADESVTNVDEMKKYAAICKDKAYRLKELTDTMFRYFYVYGKDDTDFIFQKFEAKQLFVQLLGEYVIDLMQEGFEVEIPRKIDPDLYIYIDADMFKRVIDNIFSNFKRYADKSKTIYVSAYVEDKNIVVECENTAKSELRNAESTKIGLKTCSRIMSQMNGRFEITTNGRVFNEKIYIPIIK